MTKNSFTFLNLAQFFTALNDNIYKLLLIFQLIAIQGVEKSNTILSLAGAIFVLPFIFFASTAGSLSDRFSKRNLIVTIRIIELPVILLGVLAFALKSAFLGYFVLFLMATLSALFSPSKYGIIPEIVKKEDISHYNGILTATTYLAIILGTFFASFLTDITKRNFVLASFFCVLIALLGAISSFGIKKTLPQAKDKKISSRFLTDIFRTLKKAKKVRYLLPTIIFGAFFLFLGAYTQLNIITFGIQSLKLDEIHGGYLFLMTAIGIGIGSYTAGRLSGKEIEIGIVPIATLGIALILFGLYFFQSQFYTVSSLLVLLGVLGGFYIIPIDAFIQFASPNEDRGVNVAASNFLNFIGVITASGFIYLFGNVFSFSAAFGFFLIGILAFLLFFTLLFLMLDQVVRFILAKIFVPHWGLKTVGRDKVSFTPPVLLVAERVTWKDTLIVMATLPRLIRYVVPLNGKFKRSRKILYKALRLTPIEKTLFLKPALEEVKKELALGHSVCIMYPTILASKSIADWEGKLKDLIAEEKIPIVPIHIERNKKIKVVFGRAS